MSKVIVFEPCESTFSEITLLLPPTLELIRVPKLCEIPQATYATRPMVVILSDDVANTPAMAVLRELKKIDATQPVIILGSNITSAAIIKHMKSGAFDYLEKPINASTFQEAMAKVAEAHAVRYLKGNLTKAENSADAGLDVITGKSRHMIEIWKKIGMVADSKTPVLITGESGTGKELLAQEVHSHSARSNKPFMAINCAGIPDNLVESEMFGHEKGAFTDAANGRIGKYERCDGGTLFLDEIGELSLRSQSKLLRAIEGYGFQRVGGNATLNSDVRIVAATNRNLLEEVQAGRFRLDLYHRIKVVEITVPPLRHRTADIAPLAHYFTERFARENGRPIRGILPETINLLTRQKWSGNVRELKNAIQAAVIFCKGAMLTPEDFNLETFGFSARQFEIAQDHVGRVSSFEQLLNPIFDNLCMADSKPFHNMTYALEEAMAKLALQRANNVQTEAARMLGIGRTVLRGYITKGRENGQKTNQEKHVRQMGRRVRPKKLNQKSGSRSTSET